MLELYLSKKSKNFLNKLPVKHQKQIWLKIIDLRKEVFFDSKILKNTLFFSASVGEYRIIYQLQEQSIKVFLIGKRNDGDIYKKTKRL